MAVEPPPVSREVRPPGSVITVGVGAVSVLVVAVTGWLASRPGAPSAQTGIVLWLNHPPQPLAALLALVNPLLRPIALSVLALGIGAWIVVAAAGVRERWEVVRALGVALVLAEVGAQVLKRVVATPRPLAVIPGLDPHGYPADPRGLAFPSAHTALVVGAVAAVWPWTSRGPRVVGVVLAVCVPLHRVYIGAHWPVDVIGGAALGGACAAACWSLAGRWPIAAQGVG